MAGRAVSGAVLKTYICLYIYKSLCNLDDRREHIISEENCPIDIFVLCLSAGVCWSVKYSRGVNPLVLLYISTQLGRLYFLYSRNLKRRCPALLFSLLAHKDKSLPFVTLQQCVTSRESFLCDTKTF